MGHTDDARSLHDLVAGIVESADDAVFIKDLTGTILTWNPAAERIYGYTAADMIGRSVTTLVPPDRSGEPADVLRRIRSGEAVRQYETVRKRADGQLINVSLTVSPLYDRDGSIVAASVFARDVTDRVAAARTVAERERRLLTELTHMTAENERRFRTLFENTTLLAGISDMNNRILHCNEALADLARMRPEELIGRDWDELFGRFPEDDRFYQLLEEDVVLPAYMGRARVGEDEFVVAWTNVGLRDEHGRLKMVASLGDNVTARRGLEQAMERHRTERQELIAAILSAETAERTRLAQALHDDTIQVMTATRLTIDLAAQQHPSPELRRASSALGLAISRARMLMFELYPPDLDEDGLAEAIDVLCHRAALDAGFEVSVDVCPERLPPSVEELVYRTVREAVINARRHSGAKNLRVTVVRAGDRVEGAISDDGVGFDLFCIRRRLRNGDEAHLGLTALEDRLRLARGALSIETRPNRGTTIRFSMPAA